jgi:phage FluMu protein Com
MSEPEEIRCKKCNRLLMKLNAYLYVDIPKPGGYLEVEIKCPKCRYTITFNILNKLQSPCIGEEWNEEPLFIKF